MNTINSYLCENVCLFYWAILCKIKGVSLCCSHGLRTHTIIKHHNIIVPLRCVRCAQRKALQINKVKIHRKSFVNAMKMKQNFSTNRQMCATTTSTKKWLIREKQKPRTFGWDWWNKTRFRTVCCILCTLYILLLQQYSLSLWFSYCKYFI